MKMFSKFSSGRLFNEKLFMREDQAMRYSYVLNTNSLCDARRISYVI